MRGFNRTSTVVLAVVVVILVTAVVLLSKVVRAAQRIDVKASTIAETGRDNIETFGMRFISALNVWAFLQEPKLVLQANYVNVDADGVKRTRKSWEHVEANASTAVNFSVERNPNDTPLNPHYDTGMLFYQERTF